MTILTVSSVSLAYGTDEILNDISFTVNEGERLGVIGANGAGKTTLFNILTGRLQPDRGNVTFARGAKAKLLSQKPEEDFGGRTVLDWALDSFSGLHETERRLAELERRLADGHSADAARYAALEEELLRRINALGIGPQGFGGLTTALSVRVKAAPTHIAGLPVAVNVGCHVTRHASVTL